MQYEYEVYEVGAPVIVHSGRGFSEGVIVAASAREYRVRYQPEGYGETEARFRKSDDRVVGSADYSHTRCEEYTDERWAALVEHRRHERTVSAFRRLVDALGDNRNHIHFPDADAAEEACSAAIEFVRNLYSARATLPASLTELANRIELDLEGA